MVDPFDGRTEMTSEEYRAWLSQTAQDGRNAVTMSPLASQANRPATATTARLRGIRESAFRDAVIEHAVRRGWRVMWTWNSRHSPKGWPDLFMVRGNRLIAAELKIPPNTPTQEQWDWLKALAVAGVETFVWRPDDWGAIEEVLSEGNFCYTTRNDAGVLSTDAAPNVRPDLPGGR